MGVTIELQNVGDAQLYRDITAHLEHAFSGRLGVWRVSIAGSRAAENWELRVEGPNGFERSYTLSAAAGEHEPRDYPHDCSKARAACEGVTTPFVGPFVGPGAVFISFR
jgi:hypothetical protein